MPKRRTVDAKTAELDRSGTLNPHPEGVVDPLFQNNPFFDPRDLLQARYEMLRRHRIEGQSIVETTLAFGVSRPTFYHAQTAFTERGLAGLVPRLRGPKGRHKLSGEVLQHILALKHREPDAHDSPVRAGDSTTVRDPRTSSQSRTRPAEQKKTARAATDTLIPAGAAADYEALREQLFGIERPGVRVAGLSVVVRRGLAAWACGGHRSGCTTSQCIVAAVPRPDRSRQMPVPRWRSSSPT